MQCALHGPIVVLPEPDSLEEKVDRILKRLDAMETHLEVLEKSTRKP
jgi:hypothetical protein